MAIIFLLANALPWRAWCARAASDGDVYFNTIVASLLSFSTVMSILASFPYLDTSSAISSFRSGSSASCADTMFSRMSEEYDSVVEDDEDDDEEEFANAAAAEAAALEAAAAALASAAGVAEGINRLACSVEISCTTIGKPAKLKFFKLTETVAAVWLSAYSTRAVLVAMDASWLVSSTYRQRSTGPNAEKIGSTSPTPTVDVIFLEYSLKGNFHKCINQ